jgi:myosin heavy subunit
LEEIWQLHKKEIPQDQSPKIVAERKLIVPKPAPQRISFAKKTTEKPQDLPQKKPKPIVPRSVELQKIKSELHQVKKEKSELQDQVEDLEWEKSDLEDENEELRKKKSRNGWPVEMDATLTELHGKWRKKFLVMCDMQSRLFEVAKAGKKSKYKKKEAGTMALQILDLREEIIGMYWQRDEYIKTGKLPQVDDDCLDPMLWPKKLANAERYVRDCRVELKRLDSSSDKYAKQLQRLQKWELELEKFKKLLKIN